MRVLLYADPWVALDLPPFTCSWIYNFFAPLTHTLAPRIESGEWQVRLIGGDHHAECIRSWPRHQLAAGVGTEFIDFSDVVRVFANGRNANCRWLSGEYTAADVATMNQLIAAKLDGFEPDLVLSFASPAPFFRQAFPNALVMYVEAGLGVRRPFHNSWQFDPCGVMAQGFIARFAGEITAQGATTKSAGFVEQYRTAIAAKIAKSNPFLPFIRATKERSFRRHVLLPLQVSGYFAFDGCCGFHSQFDYLTHVLERVPRDIGVFVTEYVFPEERTNPLTRSVIEFCRRRYPHFLYDEQFGSIQAPAQYLYDHVDAVVSVSSSVGLQAALLWNRLLCVPGHSYLDAVADCHDFDTLNQLLASGRDETATTVEERAALTYYLLTRCHVPETYCWNPLWLPAFLERCVARYRSSAGIDANFFDPIDSDDQLMPCLLSQIDAELPRHSIPSSSRDRWLRAAAKLANPGRS